MLRGLKWGDERGVSAVIVAVSLIAIFGAAMLSVDAGNLWQTRRGIITGTDAGALAEAQALANATNPTSCTTTSPPAWQAALAANTPGYPAVSTTGPNEGCTFYPGFTGGVYNGTGYITVAARRLSDSKFSGVLGIGDTKAYSLSAAMYGYLENFKGLRPIGVCVNNSHIREWMALKNVPPGAAAAYALAFPGHDANGNGIFDQFDFNQLPTTDPGTDTDGDGTLEPVERDHPNSEYTGASWYNDAAAPHIIHRVRMDRDSSEDLACGSDPGNWGYQDFNGGNNSQSDQADWFLNGYQENFVGIPGCRPDGSGNGCQGNTGAVGGNSSACTPGNGANTTEALFCLVANQVEFPIVVYNSASCSTPGGGGGGSNCRYTIAAMIGVILRGYEVGGAQADRFFDVEFTDIIPSGGCCVATPSGLNLGANKGVKLCAVDHDPLTLDVRCLARPA